MAISRDSAQLYPKCDCRGRGAVSASKTVSTCRGKHQVRNRRSAMSIHDLPTGGRFCHVSFYSNDRYLNGYTSQGLLLGNWIGRRRQGAQGWANYWFSSRNRLQFKHRHQKVSHEFITGGGTLTDVGIRNDYWLRPSLGISTTLQYERWLFPVIRPNAPAERERDRGDSVSAPKTI